MALLAGGTFAATASSTTAAAAASPSYAGGHGSGDGPVWGTIVSRTALDVRTAPTTHAPVVDRLSPGSQDRVECVVRGQRVNGNPYWYWLVGARAWASAEFVDTDGRWVPGCADPCPEWKDGSWHDGDDPFESF